MKGHIRKRGKNTWAIVIDIGTSKEGKRQQKWHSVKGSKKDAEKELRRLLGNIDTGVYVEPNKTTVADYLDQWIIAIQPTVSRKTIERYTIIVEKHLKPNLGEHKLNKLQPLHIETYYSDALKSGNRLNRQPLSKQTVLHHHRVLREALNKAVKWQFIGRNPADLVDPPKPEKKERQTFSAQETLELLDKAKDNRLYIPILLAVTMGLRRGEVLGLRWKDINFENNTLSVRQVAEETALHGVKFKTPKTFKSTRSVALPQITVNELYQFKIQQTKNYLKLGIGLNGDTLLFGGLKGSWKPGQLTKAYADFRKRFSFKHVTFHDLRHTHATHLLCRNIHPKIVSERLGHSTISITLDTYSYVLPNMQEEAASVTNLLLEGNGD